MSFHLSKLFGKKKKSKSNLIEISKEEPPKSPSSSNPSDIANVRASLSTIEKVSLFFPPYYSFRRKASVLKLLQTKSLL
jgi:hypothetical protein